VSFLSQRRDVIDAACAGDIIGIPNRAALNLGDAVLRAGALRERDAGEPAAREAAASGR